MASQFSNSSANALLNLIDGHRTTAVIYTAARLGIADHLVDGPKSIAELARLTGAHERSLFRLLRALVQLAICAETSDEKFQLTEVGSHLAANAENSLKAFVLLEGGMLRASWGELTESVRTGKNAAELAGRTTQEHFATMAKQDAGLFDDAMVALTRTTVPDILAAYDFSEISTLMDAGGGLGQLMCAILKEYPSMRGIIFDLPHCAKSASENLSQAGLSDRCEFVAGNFFETIPSGADAIVMKSIIHDWNDELCIRILKNCRRALTSGARLILIDKIVPEHLTPGGADLFVSLDDLNMLRGPGGCERTPSEFRELLGKGEFEMPRVVPTGRYSVIEATAE